MAETAHRVYVVLENQTGQAGAQHLVSGPYRTASIRGVQLWVQTPEGSSRPLAFRVKGGWQVQDGMRPGLGPVFDTVSFWPIVPSEYDEGTIKDQG